MQTSFDESDACCNHPKSLAPNKAEYSATTSMIPAQWSQVNRLTRGSPTLGKLPSYSRLQHRSNILTPRDFLFRRLIYPRLPIELGLTALLAVLCILATRWAERGSALNP